MTKSIEPKSAAGRPARGLRSARAVTALVSGVLLIGGMAPGASASSAPSPALVQAVSIAKESLSQVITLHDLSMSVGRLKGLPPAVVFGSAKRLAASLRAEANLARAIKASANSPTAALASTLQSYSGFAAEVAGSANSKFMPAGFSPALARTDHTWESALKALGKADHTNLLKEVPALLYPAGPGPKAVR